MHLETFRKGILIFLGVQRTLSFCYLQEELSLLNTTGNQSSIKTLHLNMNHGNVDS